MADSKPTLEAQALALPADQRERLAERLLRSIDGQSVTQIDRAWIDEAERRFAEWRAGNVAGVPSDQLTDRIRRELGWDN